MGLYDDPEADADALPKRIGCAPRLAAVLIVFFVNAPLVREHPGHLWHEAPLLVVVAVVVDLYVLGFLALSWRRRRTPDSVPDSET